MVLAEAIISKSQWSTAGNKYMNNDLKSLFEDTVQYDCEKNNLYASALIFQYKNLLE